ncbi:hypothetical protein BaRGS_00036120 [Batillaria attramentaria]|uniref:Uncharacterized protein n=1 Tax=Batillaria attramentaria TaxID=370345 RepID=A0ABD0JC71_9CAEN
MEFHVQNNYMTAADYNRKHNIRPRDTCPRDPVAGFNLASVGSLHVQLFLYSRVRSLCECTHDASQLAAHLFIRQAKKKSRLDSVSPAQYLAAYSRILARLIEIGHLSGQGIIDYLAYTAKVSEMATRYTW